MGLKQMKIVTFAMIKFPRSQDFISPISVETLHVYYHKSSVLNLPGPLLAAPHRLCPGDLPLERYGSISQRLSAGKHARLMTNQIKIPLSSTLFA